MSSLTPPQKCNAEFFYEAVPNNFETAKQGKPVYDNVEHVRITIPGDHKTELVAISEDRYRNEYPEAYAAFKRQEDSSFVQGTPLKAWPAMTPAIIKNFAYHNVVTIEQMAELHDGAIQSIGMGARDWAAKARAYLDHAAETADAGRLVSENAALKADLEAMQAQIAALSAERETPRRGRPPASAAA